MTNARRLAVYLHDGRPLTPAQARRWRHRRRVPNGWTAPDPWNGEITGWDLAHPDPRQRRNAWLAHRQLARTETTP